MRQGVLMRKDKERGDKEEKKRWAIGSDSGVKKDSGGEPAERKTAMCLEERRQNVRIE